VNNQMYRSSYQRGLSVPMVLSIMAVIMIMALTFMGIVRFQTQRTGFEQATITSAYVAEIGFQQVRAQLSAVSGDWTQLPATAIEKDCTAGNPNRLRCQKSPVNAGFTNLNPVYENPLDTTSRMIGRYEYTIETGEKRAIFGNKTVLGSTVGYISGSLIEQVGYDNYGNKLCDAGVPGGSCPGSFIGVKVKAWLTDAQGNEIPNARPQTVYGVLSMDSRDPDDQGPSSYMLESDGKMQISANMDYSPQDAKLVSYGGFYGPVHTNQNFEFIWDSTDAPYPGDYVVSKLSPNGLDEVYPGEGDYSKRLWERPFWGILMSDLGVQLVPSPPRLRAEIDGPPAQENYVYTTYGRFYKVKWLPTSPLSPPATGAGYQVYFKSPGGAVEIVNVTKPAGTVDKGIPSPLILNPAYSGLEYQGQAWPIKEIHSGSNIYLPGIHFEFNSPHLLDWWNSGAYTDTSREFPAGSLYRARPISHSPISIQEKMTYSNAVPQYRYYHTHPSDTNWPFYQTSHGHKNIAGADLAPNAISDYDTDTWYHSHNITNDISAVPIISSAPASVSYNTFLAFSDNAFKPAAAPKHEIPLLKPESDITNYKNQLEQLNKYLELTLGSTLPRNADGSINSTNLASSPYNATDYNKGYIVGKFPSTHVNTTPPQVDFRAVYFGPKTQTYDLGTLAGQRIIAEASPYTATAGIWVNDKSDSPDYMKVANEQVTADYRRYLFRPIPPEKVILVRDATVLIGNMKPQADHTGNITCTGYKAHCIDFVPGFLGDPVGEATIINGQLSILSFTTTPPVDEDQYSYGDIVIAGNVLYHNDFYANPNKKSEMRQLSAQPTSPYYRSNTVGGGVPDITNSAVEWVTNIDGSRHRDLAGQKVGSLDGLGLFASHDIKISVTPMGNGYKKQGLIDCSSGGTMDEAPNPDNLEIHGQLVAGNRVRVHAHLYDTPIHNLQRINLVSNLCSIEPPYESYRDTLTFYGTIYSRYPFNFSEYFKIKREYFFDRSLQKNPLVGAPYYPQTAGDYKNQTVYNNFPSLVPGTWVQATQ
jgi:hypothetical protein